MHKINQAALELDLEFDLTAKQLLAPLNTQSTPVESDDRAFDQTCEIELTPQQMDDLLAGRWKP